MLSWLINKFNRKEGVQKIWISDLNQVDPKSCLYNLLIIMTLCFSILVVMNNLNYLTKT